ncbi:hypothetical protein [Haloarcula marismortui]|uniref:hypothetical protein n=1 Tax=Haloarcula marismortui TaxID=2238 RepID=UPI00135F125E|nr:hypothetical protein [Haloarcula sinaiiensis]
MPRANYHVQIATVTSPIACAVVDTAQFNSENPNDDGNESTATDQALADELGMNIGQDGTNFGELQSLISDLRWVALNCIRASEQNRGESAASTPASVASTTLAGIGSSHIAL